MRGPTCAPYRCGVKAVGGYILKRLSIGIPTLLIIVTASFFLMRAAPGGPFDADVDLDPLVRANLEASYGLDPPIGTQYLRFLDGLTRFDFGPSSTYPHRSVGELLRACLPVTPTPGL